MFDFTQAVAGFCSLDSTMIISNCSSLYKVSGIQRDMAISTRKEQNQAKYVYEVDRVLSEITIFGIYIFHSFLCFLVSNLVSNTEIVQILSHPSTDQAQRYSTSVIGQELMYSAEWARFSCYMCAIQGAKFSYSLWKIKHLVHNVLTKVPLNTFKSGLGN